jgi:hypothetical protein
MRHVDKTTTPLSRAGCRQNNTRSRPKVSPPLMRKGCKIPIQQHPRTTQGVDKTTPLLSHVRYQQPTPPPKEHGGCRPTTPPPSDRTGQRHHQTTRSVEKTNTPNNGRKGIITPGGLSLGFTLGKASMDTPSSGLSIDIPIQRVVHRHRLRRITPQRRSNPSTNRWVVHRQHP